MTLPRELLRGTTYLLTRRCTQRQFLLRPSTEINDIFLYCMARASHLTGVQIHAFCVLSNHYHIVATDPHAHLPRFMHSLNLNVARALNCHYDRRENFWSNRHFSAVKLVAFDDILDKIAYTLANPVAAGLVRYGQEWPGLRTRPRDIGSRSLEARRPAHFFGSELPRWILLPLARPPGAEDLDDESFGELVASRVRDEESRARAASDAEGKRFLGPDRVLAQDPTATPTTPEPPGKRNPRIACRDRWARIEALRALGEFLKRYAIAARSFCDGNREAIFPAGTYWMRVRYGVNCAAPT